MDLPQKRRKIVMLDDVFLHLKSTKESLKNHYELYTAKTPAIFFDLLQNFMPDLILLDIVMEDCSGFEIIKTLKEDKRYADIPVIFLTSKHDKKSVIKGMAMGAVDYILKPFTDSVLRECIQLHLDPSMHAEFRPKIMAVDDNPSLLKTINYILNKQYKVYTLTDPGRLTDFVARIKPDLFIFDYNMPTLNGADLTKMIRCMPEFAKTPIIILTSERSEDKLAEAFNIGANDLVFKPITESQLREKVAYQIVDTMFYTRVQGRTRLESIDGDDTDY
jgi:PleD family two-component response regulator